MQGRFYSLERKTRHRFPTIIQRVKTIDYPADPVAHATFALMHVIERHTPKNKRVTTLLHKTPMYQLGYLACTRTEKHEKRKLTPLIPNGV